MNFINKFRLKSPKYFLNKSEVSLLSEAIDDFENKTGCELVFHFRKSLGSEPMVMAERLFFHFGLDKTNHHAAILIVISMGDRQYAVWVDSKVKKNIGDALWKNVGEEIQRHLSRGERLGALIQSIEVMKKSLKFEGAENLRHAFKKNLSNKPITEEE